jgi:hypothetical protein
MDYFDHLPDEAASGGQPGPGSLSSSDRSRSSSRCRPSSSMAGEDSISFDHLHLTDRHCR